MRTGTAGSTYIDDFGMKKEGCSTVIFGEIYAYRATTAGEELLEGRGTHRYCPSAPIFPPSSP